MKKELSIFIDESGDYGVLGDDLIKSDHNKQDELYVISFVFHNQGIDIKKNIEYQNQNNENYGFDINKPLHFAPLIRGDNDFYKSFTNEEKLSIILSESRFIKNTNISCAVFTIDKTKVNPLDEFKNGFIHLINDLCFLCNEYFNSFDILKIYYDDGQGRVKKIVQESDLCKNRKYEFKRKVEAKHYQLICICDFLCTIELIRFKRKNNCSSSNERAIFSNKDTFSKRIVKTIKDKSLSNVYLNKPKSI